jgi:ectonucleotide pyrophosphatase/phosphodiesterase family protein 5
MPEKIMFKLLTLVGSIVVCMAHEGHETSHEFSRVLLMSFDGFRWDYLNIVHGHNIKTPNFDRMIEEGVTVAGPGVTNTFVTKTLPNHYTLVTGLYQESHGLVANDFYDPWFNQTFKSQAGRDIKWWNGTGSHKVEPIWVTNEAAGQGRASGICMWPGCDVEGQTPSYYAHSNNSVPFERRADDVISWFTDKAKPINFGAIYMNEPDHTGHHAGPESRALAEKIGELDAGLGYLLDALEKHGLLHGMNIIITSDHGMAPLKGNIYLDEFVNSSLFMSYGGSPVRHVVPTPGRVFVRACWGQEVSCMLRNCLMWGGVIYMPCCILCLFLCNNKNT